MDVNQRIYLVVDYSDKDHAKNNGAKWDSQRKQWYYPGEKLPIELETYSTNAQHERNKLGLTRCKRCGTNDGMYTTLVGGNICDDCM